MDSFFLLLKSPYGRDVLWFAHWLVHLLKTSWEHFSGKILKQSGYKYKLACLGLCSKIIYLTWMPKTAIVWLYISTNSGFPGVFANSCYWHGLSVLLDTALLRISIKVKNAEYLRCVYFPSSHSLGIAKKYDCWFRKFLANILQIL